jgi:hypothetical protein
VKRHVAVLAALTTVAMSLAVAAPARAYDRDAYVYAAGHMLRSDDLPAALGDMGTGMSFNASLSEGHLTLCYIEKTMYKSPAGKYAYSALFNTYRKSPEAGGDISLVSTVTPFASASKAIAAFDDLRKALKNCKGTTTQTWTDDDGVTQTASSLTTNGRVPGVTEVGVESLFLNQNYLSTSSDGSDRYGSDTYTVFTLLNDVILSTSYSTGGLANIPTKKRAKVNEVAFTAIDRWLD